MLNTNRRNRVVPIAHLFSWVILVYVAIYAWKLTGCLGFPECYLCRTFTPDYLFRPTSGNSSTNDFTTLVNLKNFSFLMNNHVCNNTELLLLVLVHSNPKNYDKRWIIRRTWGKATGGEFKLLFMVGVPDSEALQDRLKAENHRFRDMVQGNFIDSYRNLTYKHVMALKWTKYYCPRARYLLKTDDDVFINSPSFLLYLGKRLPEKNLMRCLPVQNGRAHRTWRSKWRVKWSEYDFKLYPTFCQGFAILYSPDVVLTLYEKAQIADYFWIDDVFVTGFLAMSANFTPSTFGKYLLEPEVFREMPSDDSESIPFSYLVGPWNVNAIDINRLWEIAFKAGYVQVVDS